MGVAIESRGVAQVSMNLTDFETTPLHQVFEAAETEAARRGCKITGGEIIGLVPRRAMEASLGHDLRLENFSPDQILENRLAAVVNTHPAK